MRSKGVFDALTPKSLLRKPGLSSIRITQPPWSPAWGSRLERSPLARHDPHPTLVVESATRH